MKATTLFGVSLACVLASSAAALAVPLPDRAPVTTPTTGGAGVVAELPSKGAQLSVGKTLLLDARLGHGTLARSGSGETYLFAQVTGSDSAPVAAAPKVSLGIVIDRSGSMKGARIAHAMDAASAAVERMRDGDTVSVVAFDTVAEVIVPPQVVSADTRSRIVAKIRGIRLGGDTCISCGLESAMHELMAGGRTEGGVTRMLLLSDGATNSGIRDIPGLRSLAARMRDRGCTISTIGVDVDFDEKVMAAIANEASGRHYFVKDSSTLASVFTQEFDSLVASVASDGELTMTLAPGVEVEQVFDRTFRREGDRVIVPFGSVSKGQQKTVLMKLRVPTGATGDRPVADLRLKYRDLVDRSDGACGGSLALAVHDGLEDAPLDPFVAARLERSRTAATLTQVNLLVEQGKMAEAQARLAGRRDELKKAESVALAKPLLAGPAPRAARSLDLDFKEQLGAVASAESFGGPGAGVGGGGFAQPPAGRAVAPAAAPPAPASPATKGAVRQNQQAASDLAF
jgi:Ca-activated chloride channel family protein